MLLHIHPQDPQPRQIKTVVESLERGGVIIYPTDTIYGLGCDILQHKAIERVCRIKNVDPKKAQLSFICSDLSHLSDYAKQLPTVTYRLLKEYLPGPYTFILPASKMVPKILQSKKDTIGLRIPANNIAQAIINQLGRPILSASLPATVHNMIFEILILIDKWKRKQIYPLLYFLFSAAVATSQTASLYQQFIISISTNNSLKNLW